MKSKTFNTLIFFIIIALAGLGLNTAAFFYIKDLHAELYETQAAHDLTEKRNNELFGPGDTSAVAQVAQFSTHLIDADQAVVLIEKIENDAGAQGVEFEINSVAIDPVGEAAGASALTENIRLRFEAVGSWQKINHFLYYLEHTPYLITLENIALSRLDSLSATSEIDPEGLSPKWRMRAEVVIPKVK